MKPIKECGLNITGKVLSKINKADIVDIEDLVCKTREESLSIKGIGNKTVDEIEMALMEKGLSLKKENDPKIERDLDLLLNIAEQVLDEEELDQELEDMVISIRDKELGGLRLNLGVKGFFKIVKERILEYERI